MKELERAKNNIVHYFIVQYGFAPAKKNIIPLESSSNNGIIEHLAFRVGNIGYFYTLGQGVVPSPVYDKPL